MSNTRRITNINVANARIKSLESRLAYLTKKIVNVSGCDKTLCCMRVHFGTCDRENRCYTCPCCLELSAEQRREENERIVEREFLEAEMGYIYDDLKPESVKKSVKKPFKKVEPETESESDEEAPVRVEPVKKCVLIHRKYKNDLVVPVEEKHKVCTCAAYEEGVVYCSGCEASRRPALKKYVRK